MMFLASFTFDWFQSETLRLNRLPVFSHDVVVGDHAHHSVEHTGTHCTHLQKQTGVYTLARKLTARTHVHTHTHKHKHRHIFNKKHAYAHKTFETPQRRVPCILLWSGKLMQRLKTGHTLFSTETVSSTEQEGLRKTASEHNMVSLNETETYHNYMIIFARCSSFSQYSPLWPQCDPLLLQKEVGRPQKR